MHRRWLGHEELVFEMTSEELVKLWSDANHLHMKGTERFGQALFNLLDERWPELAQQVMGTELDPFYKFPEDSPEVFTNLWNWLKKN